MCVDGLVCWVDDYMVVWCDVGGRVIYYEGMFSDVMMCV